MLYGGDDNDQLYPEQGSNQVFGGYGNDFIYSKFNPSAGSVNMLYGEQGNDIFETQQGIVDHVFGGPGYDSVCADDFDPLTDTNYLSCV